MNSCYLRMTVTVFPVQDTSTHHCPGTSAFGKMSKIPKPQIHQMVLIGGDQEDPQ